MQGAIPFSFSAPGISSTDVGNAVTPPTVFTASGSSLSKSPQKFDHDLAKNKKRKIVRACDACRRKKTKCDGPKMHNNVCTNCIQNTRNCTYVYALQYSFKSTTPFRQRLLTLLFILAKAQGLGDLPKRQWLSAVTHIWFLTSQC